MKLLPHMLSLSLTFDWQVNCEKSPICQDFDGYHALVVYANGVAVWQQFCANPSDWSCVIAWRVESCCQLDSWSKRRGYPLLFHFIHNFASYFHVLSTLKHESSLPQQFCITKICSIMCVCRKELFSSALTLNTEECHQYSKGVLQGKWWHWWDSKAVTSTSGCWKGDCKFQSTTLSLSLTWVL